ncbi:unnamed protein product [Rhizoctonia solani]|uniref:PWI domain-containing protein n=1 Tax=Rhizoctonia solani TaxID=456999 RepID=A0A8H2WVN8_9AGAM|nr:unnamed protein product [Rhizoctonia solani]
MADAGFFKGTSAEQDRRFADKEHRLLKSMKFPPEFDRKVDMRKVELSVMRPWITKKVVELVGFEDEVVVEYVMGLLEDRSKPPDPKLMQINLTGFLESKTPAFMSSLWSLLLEAQDSPAGVPASFVQEKKEELRQKQEADERAFAEARRRGEHDLRLDEIRQRERNERRGRGGGRGGGDSFRGRGRDSGEDRRRAVVHHPEVEADPHLREDATDALLLLGHLLPEDVVDLLHVEDARHLLAVTGAPRLLEAIGVLPLPVVPDVLLLPEETGAPQLPRVEVEGDVLPTAVVHRQGVRLHGQGVGLRLQSGGIHRVVIGKMIPLVEEANLFIVGMTRAEKVTHHPVEETILLAEGTLLHVEGTTPEKGTTHHHPDGTHLAERPRVHPLPTRANVKEAIQGWMFNR